MSRKRFLGGSPEEKQLLHDIGSLDNGIIRDQVQTMLKHLQPEQFIDRLMSSGVLSVEEHSMLPQALQNQEKFLEIVTQIFNKKTKSNFLLAMVIECDPDFHCESTKVVADFIKQNMTKLIECLDVDNGLADCLFSKQVLTSEQYEKLSNKSWWLSYQEQNRELLSNMLLRGLASIQACKMFLTALVETDQRHIFNFINNSLGLYKVQVAETDHCRILTADELNRIRRNLFHLIKLIDPSPTFLDSLLKDGCITQPHRERIEVQQTTSDKNKELLIIIRRRSYEDFETFKRVMKTTQRNGIIIFRLFESGHVISIDSEIDMESEQLKEQKELETKISSDLTYLTILPQCLTQEVATGLNGMHEVGIDVIGATPTGSVIVYFSCQTFQSIVAFKQMVLKGELTHILEELFNRILGLSALFRVRLIVFISETEYQSCIKEARRAIYSEDESTNIHIKSECYMRHMPRELLELILLKSIVGIMSVEWRRNVADIKSVYGGYNLYETISNKTWMSAYISLKSVTYLWSHVRKLNRGVAMKQFILRHLHEHYTIFAEQLNCRYVLLDCLEKEGVITDEEIRNILEAGDDVAMKTYEDISASCWPQMRDSEQMLRSNKQLLKCLFEKTYYQISQFLKIMDDIGLTHILNNFINSDGSPQTFGDVWHLPYARRINIIECGTAMLTAMNILDLSEMRGKMKTGQKFRTKLLRCSSIFEEEIKYPHDYQDQEKILTKSSHDKILVYSRIDEFDRHREVNPDRQNFAHATINELKDHREGNPDRQNLIDLLYTKGCISLLHKQHIEQQPTRQLKNLVILLLIKNGNIRTYKVALEYFRSTNQSEVYSMLNRKYIREEIQSPEWIGGITKESLIAVAWLENQLYVTSMGSNKGLVIQDSEITDCSEIELTGMQNPMDITASRLSRSVFISNPGEGCIWMIQMPGRKIKRRGVLGVPRNMSVSSSDVLVVCILCCDRHYLNLFRSSDMKLIGSILLPTKIKYLNHAVQLLNGHFVISYLNADKLDSCIISVISSDGRNIIRSFDPLSFKLNPCYHWNPYYISMDEDENIFIADYKNDRIVLLNSSWTDLHILLNNDQHDIKSPRQLCYVREKHTLIVTQESSYRSTQGVLVFDLRPQSSNPIGRQTVKHELGIIKSGLFETS